MDVDDGRGLDTMGPNISRSLFWLVLVLLLLVDAAAGASVTDKLVLRLEYGHMINETSSET